MIAIRLLAVAALLAAAGAALAHRGEREIPHHVLAGIPAEADAKRRIGEHA